MPTSLALSLIQKHVRALHRETANFAPAPWSQALRAVLGLNQPTISPPTCANPSGLSFFLWKISLLLFKQLLRVFCVFSGIPRLGKRAGLIPY